MHWLLKPQMKRMSELLLVFCVSLNAFLTLSGNWDCASIHVKNKNRDLEGEVQSRPPRMPLHTFPTAAYRPWWTGVESYRSCWMSPPRAPGLLIEEEKRWDGEPADVITFRCFYPNKCPESSRLHLNRPPYLMTYDKYTILSIPSHFVPPSQNLRHSYVLEDRVISSMSD